MAKQKAKKQNAESGEQTPFEADVNHVEVDMPKYSETEGQYRDFLLRLLEQDRDNREQAHDEFNGLSYTDRYEANMKAGNSYTPPRKNAEDTSIVTGTTREKKNAIINSVLSLVFDTTFRAFDPNNLEDQQLGEAMTDCVFQANQIEQWDEKKVFAYCELADQGDVFIQDNWIDETRLDKKKVRLSSVTEEMYGEEYDHKGSLKVIFSGARRTILPGTQVYLGNIRTPEIKLQPRIFTREVMSYEQAKSIYGILPRWKNVPRNLEPTDIVGDDHFGYNWRLESLSDGSVEVLIYQDKWNDEFQIIINGVLMLPVGFPMPWEHGEYNIVQGHLEPISAFFAYSKSIPDKTFLDQRVLDEMYRLAVLKTQKSFMPPIANYSANILTKKMFLPGAINNDLEKGEVEVLGGNPNMYAMQSTEFEMMKMIKGYIDEKSVNPKLQGESFGSRTTAVEVDAVMKQAKQQLGMMIFGFMNLHLQLDYLRLMILLENYTKDTGDKVSKLSGDIEKKYRAISVERELGERGTGLKRIEFTENQMTPEQIYDAEEGVTRDEDGVPIDVQKPKVPVRMMQISPSALRNIKYRWYPEVRVNERESSLADKISFEDRIVKAGQLFGIQSINQEYAKQQWAAKNKINPSYFFTKGQIPVVPQEEINQIQESSVNKIQRGGSDGVQQAARQGAGG